MKLLIVEDNKSLNDSLCKKLKLSKHLVDQAYDGEEALDYLSYANYDVVIMDIMMPKLNGYETLKRIRARNITTPVLFLSAKDNEIDIINGLNLGADDYISKPFSYDVLLARINVLARRNVKQAEPIFRFRNLKIDTLKRETYLDEEKIELSNKEYELLLLLVKGKNRIITREEIVSNLYEYDNENESNVIEAHIRNLRKKLKDYSYLIKTVRSVGYTMEDEA